MFSPASRNYLSNDSFPEALRRFPVFSVLPLREASGWDEAKAFIPVALNPLLAFVEKNTHTHTKKTKTKK